MALSRKNQRALDRLRKDAETLWEQQQSVLESAKNLAAKAATTGREVSGEELVPALRDGFGEKLAPRIEQAKGFATKAPATILPALAQLSAVVAAKLASLGDAAPEGLRSGAHSASRRFEDGGKAAKQKAKQLERAAKKAERRGPGVGGWFLIGAGVAAVGAVAYALWQTFRSDDDLWIADEELDAPVTDITKDDDSKE